MPTERPSTPRYTCGGCENTWTPLNACHCSGCHSTFGGVALFDRHRVRSQCIDPATIVNKRGESVMKADHNGLWRDAREFSAFKS